MQLGYNRKKKKKEKPSLQFVHKDACMAVDLVMQLLLRRLGPHSEYAGGRSSWEHTCILLISSAYGLPSKVSQLVKESACNGWFDSWVGRIPWRRKGQPTPVFLPEKSHGQRSLAGCRVAIVGHDLATKPPPRSAYVCNSQRSFSLSFGGSGGH